LTIPDQSAVRGYGLYAAQGFAGGLGQTHRRRDREKWGKVIREAGIKANQWGICARTCVLSVCFFKVLPLLSAAQAQAILA
jgi:hypothetical protein